MSLRDRLENGESRIDAGNYFASRISGTIDYLDKSERVCTDTGKKGIEVAGTN